MYYNIIPEIFLIFFILFIFFYNLQYSISKVYRFPILVENTINLSIYFIIFYFFLVFNQPYFNSYFFNDLFYKQEFTMFIHLFLIILFFIFLILSKRYTLTHYNSFELILLYLISFIGFTGMIYSNHFFAMYLSLEVQSICFYVIIACRYKSMQAIESSLKYFILGSVSSSILLFGISYIYGYSGLVFFEDLSRFTSIFVLHQSFISPYILGIFLLFFGIFFKIYAAPFHFWISDIYQGSPYNVTMFFAIIPFLSFFVVLFKFCFFVFADIMFLFREIFYIISILSMFFGSLFAIGQFQFKRMIAYSSIAHVGYFLICFTSLSIIAFLYTLSYIIIYILTSVIIFGIILNLPLKSRDTFSYLNNLSSFYLFSRYNIYLSLIFVISLFSVIGIPPFPGFIVKLYILNYLIDFQSYFISFIFICSSIFSSFYFLRIIKYIIFAVSSKSFRYLKLNTNNIDYLVILTLYYLFIFSIIYIFYSDYILDILQVNLLSLFL